MGRTLPQRDQDAPFWPRNPANKKVGFQIRLRPPLKDKGRGVEKKAEDSAVKEGCHWRVSKRRLSIPL